jgi:hypothetical protein
MKKLVDEMYACFTRLCDNAAVLENLEVTPSEKLCLCEYKSDDFIYPDCQIMGEVRLFVIKKTKSNMKKDLEFLRIKINEYMEANNDIRF